VAGARARTYTIGEVLERLDAIIEYSRRTHDRMGYFAALYRSVTAEVARGIDEGWFERPELLERFDVVFAERYFDALARWRAGRPAARSWTYAFERTKASSPPVLEHLLLGMNAHINFDLGIAAVEVTGGDDLALLQHDYERINDVLWDLLDDVQESLNQHAPALAVVDRLGGTLDERGGMWAIRQSRELAWGYASRLQATASGYPVIQSISAKDAEVVRLARLISSPSAPLSLASKLLGPSKRRSVGEIIELIQVR